MNVTDLDGRHLFLFMEDVRELVAAGKAATPTKVVLKETGGATIIDELHYADFEGNIRLDLEDILTGHSSDMLPTPDWAANEEQCLDLTLEIDGYPYSFMLNAMSRDALHMMSDIDFLYIPERISIPVSFLSNEDQGCEVFLESSSGTTTLGSMTFGEDLPCAQFCRTFDVSSLPVGKGTFRLACQIFGHNSGIRRSPMYKVTPGDYELYLFRNRFGAMEIFPMGGSLEYAPAFKIETSKYGRSYRCSGVESDDILRQSSGNLTRKAAQVLTAFLKSGRGYHWINGVWEPIAIKDINTAIKTTDSMHSLSFSFRYQNPIEIQNIM